jgi:hypothetical protein
MIAGVEHGGLKPTLRLRRLLWVYLEETSVRAAWLRALA